MKIAINTCYGGFGLSEKARKELKQRTAHYDITHSIKRNDPHLIAIIEEMGSKASAEYADIVIVEIPDDIEWQIEEYDGKEWVAEKHRTWY